MNRLAALILCLATPSAADTRQHGNLVFDLPLGWSVGATRDDGSLTLLSELPNHECEFCYVYITPGQAVQTRLDTFLFTQLTRFIADEDTPEREVIMQPETINVGGRPGAILGQTVDNNLQVLMAVQLIGRIELIAFEGDAADADEARESLAVFQRDVVPILESARFVSDGAAPLMPPAEPGDLSGLYWGFSTYWSMGLDGLMTMQFDHRHVTFWPDGTFYEGTPPQGLAPFDAKALLARGDRAWGSYRVSGNTLSLFFASGEVRILTRKGGDFIDGEATLTAVAPIEDGATIAGSLSSFFYSGFSPGSGIQGGVSSSSFVGFYPDGTWTRDASGGGFGNFDAGGGFAINSGNRTDGTYAIRDGLITRIPDDGSDPVTDLIFRTGEDIMIGDQVLETNGGDQ